MTTIKINDDVQNMQREYWKNRTLNLSAKNSFLELFQIQSTRSCVEEISFRIPDPVTARILNVCNDSNISLYILLTTLVSATITRYTNDSLTTIISPAYRKNQETPAVEFVILQDHIERSDDVKTTVKKMRKTIIEAYSNQDFFKEICLSRNYTNEELERIVSNQVLCSLSNIHDIPELVESIPMSICFERVDQEISGLISFDSGRLNSYMVNVFCSSLLQFIENACSDFSQCLNTISLLSPSANESMLTMSYGPTTEVSEKKLHELFEEQVKQTPDQTAVICNGERLSYLDLNQQADELAAGLVAFGVQPEDRVVLVFSRSLEMITAILGVLKTGAAFVPVSLEEPEQRMRHIIDDTDPKLILTNLCDLKTASQKEKRTVSEIRKIAQKKGKNEMPEFDNRKAAYIIYTSGSTGVPKGVVNEHRGIVNASIWRKREHQLSMADAELLVFSYNFDGFILNLFTPLISGATVVLTKDDEAKSPTLISEYIERYQITHFTCVPILYQALLDHGDETQLQSLKRVTLAGDVADTRTIQLSNERHKTLIVSNEYGPTENSVITTYNRSLTPNGARIIGSPIDNVNVYVLDTQMEPVPIGVFGTLFIGNVGLCREYWNHPELTKEAFKMYKGERIYCTNDLARWLPSGDVEFKGRTNDQLKIRGFRVELGEIRSTILQHPLVREAVVIAIGEHKDTLIYACVKEEEGLTSRDLQEFITHKLPEYMIPQQFILLSKLPITDSGKYDVPLLKVAVKERIASHEIKLPQNEVEAQLIEIWKRILQVENVGIDQNFFALGGHSLKATALLFEIHSIFQTDLSLNQIFITNTVQELAKVITNLKGHQQKQSILKVPSQDHYELSSAQNRMFVIQEVSSSIEMSYNTPVVFSLEGTLDRERLEAAVNHLVQRHESLRTYFKLVNNQPVQVIEEVYSISILEKSIPETDELEDRILVELSKFDLGKLPLFKVLLLRVGTTKTFLVFDFHHIIIDEKSLSVFFDELTRLYSIETPKELMLTYKDYASWQRQKKSSKDYQQKLEYWRLKLAGKDFHPLNLPYDYPRSNTFDHRGGRVSQKISIELLDAIGKFCRTHETTHFTFFLSAFSVLLSKYTHQQEIIIGSPISERSLPETQELVGLFLNTIPLSNHVDPDLSFVAFLDSVKNNVIADLGNGDVQFDDIIKVVNTERGLGQNPIFNVMLAIIDNTIADLQLENIIAENVFVHNGTAKFDLLLEIHKSENTSTLVFEYSKGLFEEQTINRLVDSFNQLLETIIHAPEARISEMKILNDRDKEQLLKLGNGNYNQATSTETIISLFEKQVEMRPSKQALIMGDQSLTYHALNKQVNQLAYELKLHIQPTEIVGILCERSFSAIICILAIQKAGGVYLPIDTNYPIERINTVLSNSKTSILLTNQSNHDELRFDGKTIQVEQTEFSDHSHRNPELILTPEDNAYVLYTSGTTGVPKGVLVSQRNVVNLIEKTTPYFSLKSEDVLTLFHSYCFDVSVWEMYAALLNGCCLVIVPSAITKDPSKMADLILEQQVSILCQPPSAFYMLSEELMSNKRTHSIRYIVLGGEAVKLFKLKDWYKHYPETKLINGYGITETSVYSTYKEISAKEINQNIGSIGSPIQVNYIYILDSEMNLCPMGVVGEIYIGGLAVGNGYLHNSELTRQRFIDDPYREGQRLYKSGDLARWYPNGEIEYVSRLDHQVKVRGYRVEISEIESTLSTFPGISDVAVVGLDEANGTQLVAYFVSTRQEDHNKLREYLHKFLLHYMVPAYFVQLDKIPLSHNGKIDRSKLPNPKKLNPKKTMNQETTNPFEKLLLDIWADVLGLSSDEIGVDDDFFSIGGDSISASLIIRKLNGYNIDVEIEDILENSTITEFGNIISENQKEIDLKTSSSDSLTYWQNASLEVVGSLPKRSHEITSINGEKKVLQTVLPFRELHSIVDMKNNNVQFLEIVLASLGMTMRMLTGEDRFRITMHEVFQGASPIDHLATQQNGVFPIVLEIGDINRFKESINSIVSKLENGRRYKQQFATVLDREELKMVLSNEVLFQYAEATVPRNVNPSQASSFAEESLQYFMKGALCVSCFVHREHADLSFSFLEEVFNTKQIQIMLENFNFSLRQVIDHYSRSEKMPRKKIIMHEVEPFNSVFYRDCTYQAFIPSIRHFGRNFELMFANSNSVYEVEENASGVNFKNRYLIDKTNDDLMSALGINLNEFYGSQDISDDLMNFLAEGSLAIVQVDCYYIPRKKELYQKKHGAHSMLVYGYDEKQELFHIIDNASIEGANYQKNTISFNELKVAYKGYNEQFNPQRNSVTLYTLTCKNSTIGSDYNNDRVRAIAIENIQKVKDQLTESKKQLKGIYARFIEISSDEQRMMKNVTQINHVFGEVLNAKKVEQYKFKYIIKDEAIIPILDDLVDHLEYMRNVLTKMEISQGYNEASVVKIQDKLKTIVELESLYISKL